MAIQKGRGIDHYAKQVEPFEFDFDGPQQTDEVKSSTGETVSAKLKVGGDTAQLLNQPTAKKIPGYTKKLSKGGRGLSKPKKDALIKQGQKAAPDFEKKAKKSPVKVEETVVLSGQLPPGREIAVAYSHEFAQQNEDALNDNFRNAIQWMQGGIGLWAVNKGWWEEPYNDGEKVSLMHSELSEALEFMRNDPDAPDENCPNFKGVEVELADTVIRILEYAGKRGLRIGPAIVAKMSYNWTRAFKHGGKKF